MTERDRDIVESVAKMRFATTSHLARLHFGSSHWAANKRLRKLLDAGRVRAWVRNLSEENVYSLDRRGVRILSERGEDENSWTVPKRLDGNLEHLLAINDVRVSLAIGLSDVGGEIAWWRSDWELRVNGKSRVVPDALFAISWDGREEQVFALEVENRTRSTRGFLRKTLAYASSRRECLDRPEWLVLVVGLDERWTERYRLAVGHFQGARWMWFTTLRGLGERGVAEPIWKSADGEREASLRELALRPYGKEGFVPGTSTSKAI